MLPFVKIISHAPQESVVYSARPLVVYAAVHAPDSVVVSGSVEVNGNEAITDKVMSLGQDFVGRMPVECYTLLIPPESYSGSGTLVVTVKATSSGGTVEDSVTVKVFPEPQATQNVTSSATLSTALTNIASGSDDHTLVSMAAGSYTFPAATGLDTDDTKLVTFRRASPDDAVFIEDQDTFVRRARWENVTFRATSLTDAAITLKKTHTHHFYGCTLTNASGGDKSATFGLIVPRGAWAKTELCYFHGLGTAVVGADVVRNCFWKDVLTTVFQGIRRVLEATVGEGSPSLAWAYWDDEHTPSIRHNVGLLGAAPTVIRTDAARSFNNTAIVGNSFQTTGASGIRLMAGVVDGNYIVHNTLRTSTSTGSALVTGSARPVTDNYVVANFLASAPDYPSAWFGTNTFDYNASEAAIDGDHALSAITPLFANAVGVLQQNSPLLGQALTQVGVGRAFGTLPYQEQIGAVPFHPDSTNASVLSHVANWPEFQVSLS